MNTSSSKTQQRNGKPSGLRRMIIKLSRKLTLIVTWRPRARVSRLLAMLLAASSTPALALPSGEQVVSGNISVARPDSASMTVTQTSDKGIINWNSYGIGAGEAVNYLQPGAFSVTLNRVLGGDASEIFGQLSANGQLFLINPNGVLFAPGAQVDVGGLVTSTLGIGDDDFLAGRYTFQNAGGAGSVVNQGSLKGRYIALIAPNIDNGGNINANGGTAALAAGDRVSLDLSGDGLLQVSVDAAAAGASIQHSGAIVADGGKVFITAKSADALMDTVINVSGLVRAQSLSAQNGVIRLDGGNSGVVSVSGTLDAQGGEIAISGAWVGNSGTISANDAGRISIDSIKRTVMLGSSIIEAKGGGEVRINQPGAEGFTGAHANTSTVMYQGAVIDTTGGGDNGFVEVSGAAIAVDAGTIKAGTILFDPLNITFSNAADANTTGFVPPGDLIEALADNAGLTSNFAVDGSGILNTVAAGSTITFQATNDITVSDAFNLQTATAQANVSLVLEAGNDINVNAAVTADGTGSITMTATDTIDSTGFGITTGGGAVTLNAATMALGAINTGAGLLTITNSGAATQSGVFTGSGGLTKNGAGTLTLSQANTYSGTTLINAGTLALGASGVMTGDVNVNGGTFAIGASSETVDSVTLVSGSITGTTGVLTANTYAVESGTISAILGDRSGGTSSLTKTTAGVVTLSGDNLYEGLTSVSAGTLTVGHANALGTTGSTAGTSVATGATLHINAVAVGGEAVTLNGGTLSGTGTASLSGAIDLDADSIISVASGGILTLSGEIEDGGSAFGLTKSGAGTVVLSGTTNGYDGHTQINAGTVIATDNTSLGGTGQGTDVASGATLVIQNVTVGEGIAVAAGGTLALTGAAAITPSVAINGSLDYSGYGSAVNFGLGGTATGLTGGWTTTGTPAVVGSGNNDTVSGSGQTFTLTNGVADSGSNGTVSWTSFEHINDATGTVNFNTSGSVSGNVTAQTLNFGSYGSGITLNVTADSVTGVGGTLTGVSTVNANAAQTNTVTGTAATYSLTDATPNAGSSSGYSWTALQNISDATGTVDFNASGSVTGNVTAATLDYSGSSSDITLNVSTGAITNDGVGGTLSGFTTVHGNAARNNTVTSNGGATYSLTNATPDAGSAGGYTWTALQNISDATGTVDFNASGSVSGNVTAATLDYSGSSSNITLNVSTGAITNDGVGGTLSGFTTVQANSARNNTVSGAGATYSLTNATPNAGSSGVYTWTALQNISDATGTVDFNASGSVTGNVTAPTLDYSGYGSAVTFNLNGGASTGMAGWTGVTSVTGSANSDTISGSGQTYNLTGANAGNNGTVFWTEFENLSLSGASTIVGSPGSSLAGSLADTSGAAATSLSGDITAGSLHLQGAATLAADATVSTTNDVDFDSTINGAFTLSLTSTAGDVLLGGQIGTVGTPLTSLSIDTSGGMSLPAVHAGALSVTAGGAIGDTGELAISGNASFDGSSLTLGESGETTNFGSLTFNTTGSVNIAEDSAMSISGVNSVGGDLTLTGSGNIDAYGSGGSLTVTGNLNVTAPGGFAWFDYYTGAGHDYQGVVNITARDSIYVLDINDLDLGVISSTTNPYVFIGANGAILNSSGTASVNAPNDGAGLLGTAYLYALGGGIGQAAVSGPIKLPLEGIYFTPATQNIFINVQSASSQAAATFDTEQIVVKMGDGIYDPVNNNGQVLLSTPVPPDPGKVASAAGATQPNQLFLCSITPAACTDAFTGDVFYAFDIGGILNAASQDLFNASFGTDNIRVAIQNGFLTQFGVVPPGIDAIDGDGVNVPGASLALVIDPPPFLIDEEELKRRSLPK